MQGLSLHREAAASLPDDRTPMSDQHASDVLIIDSGISGLSLALRLADDRDVTVVNKSRFPESNS